MVAAPVCSLTNSERGPLSHTPPPLVASHSLDNCYPDRGKMKSQSAFDLHFPNYCGWWTFSATFFLLLGNTLFSNGPLVCFDLIFEFLVYSGYWSSVRCIAVRCIAGKGSLLFCGLSLRPIDSSFSCAELFSFVKSTQSLVLILGQMDSCSDTYIF